MQVNCEKYCYGMSLNQEVISNTKHIQVYLNIHQYQPLGKLTFEISRLTGAKTLNALSGIQRARNTPKEISVVYSTNCRNAKN